MPPAEPGREILNVFRSALEHVLYSQPFDAGSLKGLEEGRLAMGAIINTFLSELTSRGSEEGTAIISMVCAGLMRAGNGIVVSFRFVRSLSDRLTVLTAL